MDYSVFRKKLNEGEIDPYKKEELLKECEYFASVAPKPLLSFLRRKQGEQPNPTKVGLLALLALFMFPLVILALQFCAPFLVLLVIFVIFIRPKLAKPEYKNYNYRERIAEPALRLFGDRMDFSYHRNSDELVDSPMSYHKALVDAYLVRPGCSSCKEVVYSNASYDWENESNTDAFECMGNHLYDEYTDSDGHTHTTTYFSGLILKFRTSFTVSGSVNIMSTMTKKTLLGREKETNHFKKIKDRALAVIDTENKEFSECFDVIATYEAEAYRYLTPAMIETLLSLRVDYFFAICIKGNVMTVAIDKKNYNSLGQNAFVCSKPGSRPRDVSADLEEKITRFRNALLSIYDLKDKLDPDGRYASRALL